MLLLFAFSGDTWKSWGQELSLVTHPWHWTCCHLHVEGLCFSIFFQAHPGSCQQHSGPLVWQSFTCLVPSMPFCQKTQPQGPLCPLSPGPISSILVNRYGSRPVVMFGGLLCGVGMISAAFCTSILQLYICVGFITGENRAPPSLHIPSDGLGLAPLGNVCTNTNTGQIKSL